MPRIIINGGVQRDTTEEILRSDRNGMPHKLMVVDCLFITHKVDPTMQGLTWLERSDANVKKTERCRERDEKLLVCGQAQLPALQQCRQPSYGLQLHFTGSLCRPFSEEKDDEHSFGPTAAVSHQKSQTDNPTMLKHPKPETKPAVG